MHNGSLKKKKELCKEEEREVDGEGESCYEVPKMWIKKASPATIAVAEAKFLIYNIVSK